MRLKRKTKFDSLENEVTYQTKILSSLIFAALLSYLQLGSPMGSSLQFHMTEFTRAVRVQTFNVTTLDKQQVSAAFECPLEPCHLNMVFMGDSLTRYMYISLVHFLRFNNTWIQPTDQPNMVVAKTYLDSPELHAHWTHFYLQTMAKLAPYENCDCFRAPYRQKKPICENRYFYDPTRNNTITYIQAFGKATPVHGHWLDPVRAAREPSRIALTEEELQTHIFQSMNQTQSTQYKIPAVGPMPDNIPDIWSGGWEFAIESHVKQIQPDVLILNAGKWSNDLDELEPRQSLVNATRGIPRVIWKTTTSNVRGLYKPQERLVDEAMCGLLECFNISSWSMLLANRFYHDKCHYYEPVYRKMNEELFRFLGVPAARAPVLDWTELGINASTLPIALS
jgi:hypothetical protein